MPDYEWIQKPNFYFHFKFNVLVAIIQNSNFKHFHEKLKQFLQ